MFAYNPTPDRSGEILGAGQMRAADTQANMYNQLGNNIGGALASLGEMYGKFKDKKDMLAGMDTAARAMVDLKVMTPDFYEKYMASDEASRPFLFQAIASPMFQSYNAGRSAAAQAQAWDQYKSKWGSNAGGAPNSANNQYGYVYQGP
jgi:hypothetical protein